MQNRLQRKDEGLDKRKQQTKTRLREDLHLPTFVCCDHTLMILFLSHLCSEVGSTPVFMTKKAVDSQVFNLYSSHGQTVGYLNRLENRIATRVRRGLCETELCETASCPVCPSSHMCVELGSTTQVQVCSQGSSRGHAVVTTEMKPDLCPAQL